MSTAEPTLPSHSTQLGSPELRKFLVRYVSKHVPANDVDDIVQSTLVSALSARRVPEVEAEVRVWVATIAAEQDPRFVR